MLAERGARCLRQLSSGRAGALVSRIEPEKAARLLRRLEPEEIPPLLAQADEKRRSALERLLRYPEGAAGSFMDPLVLALPPDLKVSQALKQLSSDPTFATTFTSWTRRKN
jgi:Mg/Co/Ni transporter MgtE